MNVINKVVYENQVDEVTIPTADGEITVLPDHIPLISVLAVGEVRIKKGDAVEPFVARSRRVFCKPCRRRR